MRRRKSFIKDFFLKLTQRDFGHLHVFKLKSLLKDEIEINLRQIKALL